MAAADRDEEHREKHADDHGQRSERDLLVVARVQRREQPDRLDELRADVERLDLTVGQEVDDRVGDEQAREQPRRERRREAQRRSGEREGDQHGRDRGRGEGRREQRLARVLGHQHGVDDRARRERADRQLARADADSAHAARFVGRVLMGSHRRHRGYFVAGR